MRLFSSRASRTAFGGHVCRTVATRSPGRPPAASGFASQCSSTTSPSIAVNVFTTITAILRAARDLAKVDCYNFHAARLFARECSRRDSSSPPRASLAVVLRLIERLHGLRECAIDDRPHHGAELRIGEDLARHLTRCALSLQVQAIGERRLHRTVDDLLQRGHAAPSWPEPPAPGTIGMSFTPLRAAIAASAPILGSTRKNTRSASRTP